MSDKDSLIAALLLKDSANTFKQSMDSLVDTARLDAHTAEIEKNTLRLKNQGMQNHIANMKSNLSNQRARIEKQELEEVQDENDDLRKRLTKAETEIGEMRVAMREWVASQRGLLALANALREEVQTCPSKEHHKLADKDARFDLADAAADASYNSNEAETVKNFNIAEQWCRKAASMGDKISANTVRDILEYNEYRSRIEAEHLSNEAKIRAIEIISGGR